jgi:hypothetical protein
VQSRRALQLRRHTLLIEIAALMLVTPARASQPERNAVGGTSLPTGL